MCRVAEHHYLLFNVTLDQKSVQIVYKIYEVMILAINLTQSLPSCFEVAAVCLDSGWTYPLKVICNNPTEANYTAIKSVIHVICHII